MVWNQSTFRIPDNEVFLVGDESMSLTIQRNVVWMLLVFPLFYPEFWKFNQFFFYFSRKIYFSNSNFLTLQPSPLVCFFPQTEHLYLKSTFLVGFSLPFGFSFGKLPYPFIFLRNLLWPWLNLLLGFFLTISTVCKVCFLQNGQNILTCLGIFIFSPNIIEMGYLNIGS